MRSTQNITKVLRVTNTTLFIKIARTRPSDLEAFNARKEAAKPPKNMTVCTGPDLLNGLGPCGSSKLGIRLIE